MSFPRNSAFNQHQLALDQAAEVAPTNVVPGPVRHVGRPNIVEIPLDVLERWVNDLNDQEGDSFVDVVPDLLFEMRSYLRG